MLCFEDIEIDFERQGFDVFRSVSKGDGKRFGVSVSDRSRDGDAVFNGS